MSTQINIQKMVDGMVAQGVPASQALALATCMEHALNSKDYAKQYGTYMVEALQSLIDKAME